MLAIEILVQAIVVVRPVVEQQRRRTYLARGVAAREELLVLLLEAQGNAQPVVPTGGYKPVRNAATNAGSGYAKYRYSPLPKP